MIIENNTRASKSLLGKFCFANMFHRGKNLLVIFPLLVIFMSVLIMKFYPDLSWLTETVISIAIAFPLFIVAINVIVFNKSMRNYPKEGKSARVDFTDEGIFAGGIERDKKIDYSFVIECVEFHSFFIMYFKASSPIVLDKKGFGDGQVKEFRGMMKRNLG